MQHFKLKLNKQEKYDPRLVEDIPHRIQIKRRYLHIFVFFIFFFRKNREFDFCIETITT